MWRLLWLLLALCLPGCCPNLRTLSVTVNPTLQLGEPGHAGVSVGLKR